LALRKRKVAWSFWKEERKKIISVGDRGNGGCRGGGRRGGGGGGGGTKRGGGWWGGGGYSIKRKDLQGGELDRHAIHELSEEKKDIFFREKKEGIGRKPRKKGRIKNFPCLVATLGGEGGPNGDGERSGGKEEGGG